MTSLGLSGRFPVGCHVRAISGAMAASEFLADARWPVQKGHEEPSRVRLTIVTLQA